MADMCGDNRFEIIAKAKAHLLDATNIETSEDEMKVLDNFLFRCWQMGWLDRYDEPNSSEKPNNCEHITEDGVTCARYPACGDCLDNPLNKVKGSERFVKGSEKPNNSTISKMEQVDKDINVRSKDEPQMGDAKPIPLSNRVTHIKGEPQTERGE